ncbi:MAG: hypothetical protein LBN95_02405, partial [Prevotellaceae bacterium]|nr:hypothetical protein [Prevotellaceae bacterium]
TNSDEVADDANYHDACNNQTLWFSQEVPYGSNVIFHNAYEGGQWGDGHQAIELLNVINDECYILSYGSDSYGHLDRNVVDCPVNTSLLSDNPITIKVKKSNDWNGVVGLHIHYWNACVDNISPMVEKCYNNGETDETWYEYELSGSPTNIAILLYSTFGASDQQTEDIISVSTSTCYVLNEGSGGSYGNKGYTGSSCPLDVPCTATGTPTVTAQKEILSVQYFSITGQSVSENFNGFVIKKTIYKDGTNSSEKLFLK